MQKSSNRLFLLSFILIIVFSFALFYPSLNYYFFQDDWFVLNWARTGDFLSFFKMRTDIIYWRPLSMPLFFKIGRALFDLDPQGFHLIVFFFHLVNAILVYLLFKELKISRRLSLFSAFLYATASFHFVPLSWLSTTSYVIAPTFILFTFIFFLREKLFLSFAFFILAIASSELSLAAVPILVIIKTKFKIALKQLWPFLLTMIIYITARLILFPLPAVGNYTIAINQSVLTNLFWYFTWIFNIPEKMSTIFLLASIKTSIPAIREFMKYLIFPSILIVLFLITTSLSRVTLEHKIKGILWFVLGISPVIFLPHHAFSMYLPIASLGIFYTLSKSIENLNKYINLLVYTFVTIWLVSSYLTLSFTRGNHWIRNEQAISNAYVSFTKINAASPPPDSVFLFKPANINYSKQHNFVLVETENNVKQSLNDQDAIQVLYNDSSLESIYITHQDKVDIEEGKTVFEISPR